MTLRLKRWRGSWSAFLRELSLRACHLVPLISHSQNFGREKEREHENLDAAYNEANKTLQQVETTFTNMKAQLKSKKEEVQGLLHSFPSRPSKLTSSF
jgi:septal ring factor EnvC (AmiA/AmiB activator)